MYKNLEFTDNYDLANILQKVNARKIIFIIKSKNGE
jgi:hypothetical protein